MAPKAAKAAKKTGEKGKRVASPYILFCTDKRPEVKKANPSATFGELGKLLGGLWAEADAKTKDAYKKKSEDLKK